MHCSTMMQSPFICASLVLLLSMVVSFADAFTACPSSTHLHNGPPTRIRQSFLFATKSTNNEAPSTNDKIELLNLLSKVPPNEPTPKELTASILQAVKILEDNFPTPPEDVLQAVAGNWELLWTAQDLSSLPQKRINLRSWVNPLENQSYSNNPLGRSNPLFPQNIQDNLEEIGVLNSARQADNTIKSTQAIDLKRGRVRNVVAVEVNNPTPIFSKNGFSKGFITVDVTAVPNAQDARKIDVKFDRCRVAIQDSPFNLDIGLGIIGPSGWLLTIFVDDDIRITRGHKGSVFILSRTGRRSSTV
mmetsp:Transcript_27492/g.42386  ORF Transcript_27492/g.42386 Transcript_27492/m.42386 type:complete len:303 (+) Transcript_27492:38-946(+)